MHTKKLIVRWSATYETVVKVPGWMAPSDPEVGAIVANIPTEMPGSKYQPGTRKVEEIREAEYSLTELAYILEEMTDKASQYEVLLREARNIIQTFRLSDPPKDIGCQLCEEIDEALKSTKGVK